MSEKSKRLPHQLLLDIAEGNPVQTDDGYVTPTVSERISAASAAAPYFAQKINHKDLSKHEKYMNDVLVLLQEIIERLPV